jgi:hypothetical protein
MFVASMSFFAKIADPTMAGTYMTLYDGESRFSFMVFEQNLRTLNGKILEF